MPLVDYTFVSLKFDAAHNSFQFMLSSGTVFFLTLAFILTLVIRYNKTSNFTNIKSQTMELNFAGQKISYTIECNYITIEIAYKIYIELLTRKAAIQFDPVHDVINEIYDSWHDLFKITRNEIKNIQGEVLLRDKSSEQLVTLTTDLLNKALRPHLTQYQNRYRKWLSEQDINNYKSIQEIQKNYPDYEELTADLLNVNNLLIDYADQLHNFIYQNSEG